MTPSIQTWMEKFKPVTFEEDQMEYRDMSIQIALLSTQDPISDVVNKVHEIKRRKVCMEKLSSKSQRNIEEGQD